MPSTKSFSTGSKLKSLRAISLRVAARELVEDELEDTVVVGGGAIASCLYPSLVFRRVRAREKMTSCKICGRGHPPPLLYLTRQADLVEPYGELSATPLH